MVRESQSDEKPIPLFKNKQLPRERKLSPRGRQAQRLINHFTVIAGGTGFIPLPLAGQVAVGALLVKLLSDLCKLYGVSFSDHQIKITVTAILGGAHAEWLNHYLLKYIRGYTPGLYSTGALLLRPAISGLLVYYIGKLFLGHFESGAWVRVKEQGIKQFR